MHLDVILSQDSQIGSPAIPEIKSPVTFEAHNFFMKPFDWSEV